MKTRTEYETNGDYIKFKSGFTGLINVETADKCEHFNTEIEANNYIVTEILGCEEGYKICAYWGDRPQGCNECPHGINKNVASYDNKEWLKKHKKYKNG